MPQQKLVELATSECDSAILGPYQGREICAGCFRKAAWKLKVGIWLKTSCTACLPKFGLSLEQPTASTTKEPPAQEMPWHLSGFLNEYDEVRLGRVRAALEDGRIDIRRTQDQVDITALYAKWVKDDDYLVLRQRQIDGDEDYMVVKARKRGNDVDVRRIERRLGDLAHVISSYASCADGPRDELEGVAPEERWGDVRKQPPPEQHTQVLLCTFTVDPSVFGHDLTRAWSEIGTAWNRFASRLDGETRTEGVKRVGVFRSWEAHKLGWPHVHAIIVYTRQSFPLERHTSDSGKLSWRVPYELKQHLDDLWKVGYVDVQAVVPETVGACMKEVISYVLKSRDGRDYREVEKWDWKRHLTISLTWLLRKRAWSASRWLLEEAKAAADDRRRDDDLTPPSIIQTDLEGNPVFDKPVIWEFVGMVRRSDTDLEWWEHDRTYDATTGPPPWLDKVWMPRAMSQRGLSMSDMAGQFK